MQLEVCLGRELGAVLPVVEGAPFPVGIPLQRRVPAEGQRRLPPRDAKSAALPPPATEALPSAPGWERPALVPAGRPLVAVSPRGLTVFPWRTESAVSTCPGFLCAREDSRRLGNGQGCKVPHRDTGTL